MNVKYMDELYENETNIFLLFSCYEYPYSMEYSHS